MHAIIAHSHGGADVLQVEEMATPAVGWGEVLVQSAAAGVNFMDVYQRQGIGRYAGPVPFTPGAEGAGTVIATGAGVESLSPGDRVAWASAPGSYADEVVLAADRAVPIPESIDFQTAAAVMLQGMTAHYLALSTYPVRPGDHVVVHAAAGGVGLLLTQIAKMQGGIVIATTSTDDKAELAKQAGADEVARYEELGQMVARLTGGEGAAAVYDGVGLATFDASLACLRRRGCMVLYGAASGQVAPFDLQRLSTGSLYVTRPLLRDYMAQREELLQRCGDLFAWIADGKLDVRVGATYPLADAAQAHQDLEARRTTGKLLLIPG